VESIGVDITPAADVLPVCLDDTVADERWEIVVRSCEGREEGEEGGRGVHLDFVFLERIEETSDSNEVIRGWGEIGREGMRDL